MNVAPNRAMCRLNCLYFFRREREGRILFGITCSNWTEIIRDMLLKKTVVGQKVYVNTHRYTYTTII